MARSDKGRALDRDAYVAAAKSIKARGEAVTEPAERLWRSDRQLDSNVDIRGNSRLSRNSQVLANGVWRLDHGIALPILSWFDATGSMAENVDKAFYAIPLLDDLLDWLRVRYNPQIASGAIQDVVDHPVPPIQMSQFETDIRIAEQIRLLLLARSGGDSTEDYDLALVQMLLGVQTDIYDFYGLKGYCFIIGDEIGRGSIDPTTVQQYLGKDLQSRMSMSTQNVARGLLKKWHIFYLQVYNHSYTTTWWSNLLGSNRVVRLPSADMIAAMQAALIYWTEQASVNSQQVVDFLVETTKSTNIPLSRRDASAINSAIERAKAPVGAQAALPRYNGIPMPGSLFQDHRDPWPIDWKLADSTIRPGSTPPSEEIDWTKL